MAELTEQEKLERRRQKRQQRILNSGESRLSKITGTAFPDRATPSPTPSPSISSINATTTTIPNRPTNPSTSSSSLRQRRDSDDPSEELGAPQSPDPNTLMNEAFASMFGGIAGAPGAAGGGFNPAALLGAMGGGMGGEAGAGANGPTPEQLQNLLSSPGGFNPATLLSAMSGGGEPATAVVDKSTRIWNLLHLVLMVLLGVYAVYMELSTVGSERVSSLLYSNDMISHSMPHVPVFWYFVTIELGLQSARLFYQQGTMPPTSTLATIATQLPHPFGNIVTIFLRYRLIWSCLVQDICILVFIIGLAVVVSNVLS